jgi:hypothetical protein
VALAQRQYDAVDPQNRLVAAELERRWEAKLRQLQQTRENHTYFQQTPLPDTVPPHLREQFRQVSDKLPELWGTLSNAHKKELLRSLISQVIIKRPVPDQIAIRIVWISGCYTDQTALTPIHREQDVSGYEQMIDRIQQLWQQGYNDEQMAHQLTREGFHSARSPHVTTDSVLKIRLAHHWYLPRAQIRQVEMVDGYFTVRGLAKQLAINNSTVYRFIYNKVIAPEYVKRDLQSGAYLIRQDKKLLEQLQQRVTSNKQRNPKLQPKGIGGQNV